MFKKNNAATLKDIDTFIFLFSMEIDKLEIKEILDLFNHELSKVGRVVKKEINTSQGINLECFSNHRLEFSLAQIVDEKGMPLPILKAQLAEKGMVEVCKNKALFSASTNTWTICMKRNSHTTLSALKTSLPSLLKAFLADFVEANGKEKKPTFLIVFDEHWFDSSISED